MDFNISTINGKSTRRRATKVSLTLSSLIGPDTLVLPKVLSVDNLPTNPNPPLSRSELEAWPHLKNLELPQVDGAVTVWIGVDVPEAFWIAEERRGGSKEPYAVRSKLGWAIIGKGVQTILKQRLMYILSTPPQTSCLNGKLSVFGQ